MIKSIRDYDDQTVVLNDYPCLRVIRMTDVFNFNSFRTNTSLVIKYSVVVKANYREVQVLTQMGKILHDLISKTPDITVDESRRPTGRVMMITSTNQELIGHYIYEFSIIDSSVPEYSPSINFS